MAYKKLKPPKPIKPAHPLAAKGWDARGAALPGRTDTEHLMVQGWMGRVDEIAYQMERKWGIDRLPKLVPADYAAKFYSQLRKMNQALATGSPADVEVECSRMLNAWSALDSYATAAGNPPLMAEWWEVLAKDGRLVAVTKDRVDARQVEHMVKGRNMTVWTIGELLALAEESLEQVSKVKEAFPGAHVVGARTNPRPMVDLNDDVPWLEEDNQPPSLGG